MNEAGCWALPDKWADSATVGLYPHNTYPLTDPLLPGYSCINRTNEDHLSGIVPIETILVDRANNHGPVLDYLQISVVTGWL